MSDSGFKPCHTTIRAKWNILARRLAIGGYHNNFGSELANQFRALTNGNIGNYVKNTAADWPPPAALGRITKILL